MTRHVSRKIALLTVFAVGALAGAAALAQQALPLASKTIIPKLAEQHNALIDRKAKQAPNPADANPNVVDGFRLDNGNVIYFDSSDNATHTQAYQQFIDANPLIEVPLPPLRQDRFMRANGHAFTITAPWSFNGTAVSSSTPAVIEDITGTDLGCAMKQLVSRTVPPENILGLDPVASTEYVIGSETKAVTTSSCREFAFNSTKTASAGDHLFPLAERQVTVRVTHYRRLNAVTPMPLKYPYEYEGHVPYGPQAAFTSSCNGTDNFIKVDLVYNYGAATAHQNSGWTYDFRGHFEGQRPETYPHTRIYKICTPAAGGTPSSNTTTFKVTNLNIGSIGSLYISGSYNPNGTAPAGTRRLSGFYYDCGVSTAITGTLSAVVSRDGAAANCPTSGAQSQFYTNTATTSSNAVLGESATDTTIIPTIRHNADYGVLTAKNTANNILFWENNSFEKWHGQTVAVPQKTVSYLSRVAATPINGFVTGTSNAPLTGCYVAGTAGNYQCKTDSGNFGPSEVSYAEANANCTAACGVSEAVPGCTDQVFTWGTGINGQTSSNCTVNVPALIHNQAGSYPTTATGYDGTVALRCNAGTLVTTDPPTCQRKRCLATNLSWGGSCSGPAPETFAGTSISVTNTAANYNGAGSATCGNNGSWSVNAAASSCAPNSPPPSGTACVSQHISWMQGANQCSATTPNMPLGQSTPIQSETGSTGTGTVQLTCTTSGLQQSSPTCTAKYDGVCGSANGVQTAAYPTSNLCTKGTAQDVDKTGADNAYDWKCLAQSAAGVDATCSAVKFTGSGKCAPPKVPTGVLGACQCPTGMTASGGSCACPAGQHVQGQSCVTDAPTGPTATPGTCSGAISWSGNGQLCNATVAPIASGASTSVTSDSTTGSATVKCNPSGAFTLTASTCGNAPTQGSGTCSGPITWVVGSKSCGATAPATPSGAQATVSSTNGTVGSATVTCTSGGAFALDASSCGNQTQAPPSRATKDDFDCETKEGYYTYITTNKVNTYPSENGYPKTDGLCEFISPHAWLYYGDEVHMQDTSGKMRGQYTYRCNRLGGIAGAGNSITEYVKSESSCTATSAAAMKGYVPVGTYCANNPNRTTDYRPSIPPGPYPVNTHYDMVPVLPGYKSKICSTTDNGYWCFLTINKSTDNSKPDICENYPPLPYTGN